MTSKQEFQAKIAEEISSYPEAARLYAVRDPRLLSGLNAMAAMLALLSEEQQVASQEPFTKARDMTILADATCKGVLPFGKSAMCTVNVANGSTAPFTVTTGRVLRDQQGRRYSVEIGATIAAGGTGQITVKQRTQRSFTHTVTVSMSFYQIEVPAADVGLSIASVRMFNALGVEFKYTPDFVNVPPGDLVFHMHSDEQQKLYIKFGGTDIAGYQPSAGEVFTINIEDTSGNFTLGVNSAFEFEYTGSPLESQVALTLAAISSPGAGPMDINTLRELTYYPSTYDTSAVYLGNFDFLVRRNLSPFRFLSVWNEAKEEAVRGASVDNINTLFVAAVKDGVDDTLLRQQIKKIIMDADDSYKIRNVAVVEVEIELSVMAKVAAVYDFAQVKNQIEEIIIANFGRDSAFAKSGQNRVLYKKVYDLLVPSVPALQGDRSDLEVEVDDADAVVLPENYRYVSLDSLTVTVEQYL